MPIHLENEMLSLALPDGWVDQSDNDVLDYIHPSTNEELTIGFGQVNRSADRIQLSEALWRLIQAKASAFGEMSAGQFTVREDVVKPAPGVPSVGEFSGVDSRNSVYARVVVTGFASHFVTITYYLHRCETASAEIDARARTVISMCRVKP